jgi:hypothetical protein
MGRPLSRDKFCGSDTPDARKDASVDVIRRRFGCSEDRSFSVPRASNWNVLDHWYSQPDMYDLDI